MSETEGEEDDESQPTKKEIGGHETHSPHVGAMKKLTAITNLLSLSAPDSSKSGYETTIDFLIDLPLIATEYTSGCLKTGNQKCEILTFTLKVDNTILIVILKLENRKTILFQS